jgi:hypothetical protein
VLSENCVPKDAFKGAKGVLFLQAAAAAAGLTAFRGKGFVTANVNGQWSAPAFIKLESLGVGLSLGGQCANLEASVSPESVYFLVYPVPWNDYICTQWKLSGRLMCDAKAKWWTQ